MLKYKPTVSIGMPIYNGEKFVRQALDSILSQNFSDFELIISDNASTDNTQEICLEYEKRDQRISFYKNEINLGAYYNFNKVLELAKADYFMWASHDDTYEIDYISILVNLLNNSNESALALSMFNAIDENDLEVIPPPYSILILQSNDTYERLSRYIMISEDFGKAIPIHGLMRRDLVHSAFQTVSPFLNSTLWGSDALLIFQLLSLGDIAFSKEVFFHKRLTSQSQSLTIPIDWKNYFNGYEKLIEDNDSLNTIQKQNLKSCLKKRRLAVKTSFVNNILQQMKNKTTSVFKKLLKL